MGSMVDYGRSIGAHPASPAPGMSKPAMNRPSPLRVNPPGAMQQRAPKPAMQGRVPKGMARPRRGKPRRR